CLHRQAYFATPCPRSHLYRGRDHATMALRSLSVLVVIFLCGCTSPRMFKELGIYTGPVFSTCGGSVTSSEYQSPKCLTRAEHKVALKKTRHILEVEAAEQR